MRLQLTQKQKWEFPPKRVPVDFRTPELIERVRQLWEANENQDAMLVALHADGFSVTERQLRRVRTENQMLFKVRVGSTSETNMQAEDLQRESPEIVGAFVEDVEPPPVEDISNLLDNEEAFAQALQAESGSSTESQPTLAEEIYAGTLSHLQRANWADDRLQEPNVFGMCLIVSQHMVDADELADARRRSADLTLPSELEASRTTQPGDTIHLTTPAQPIRRTTPSMEDCKSTLDIDDDAYWNIRDNFKGICIEMGVQEKKYATDFWNVAIARLIEENVHLHGLRTIEVGPTQEDAEKHKLQLSALDKICIAVAKVLREGGPRVQPSNPKTILGLNRSTTNEIMQSFESFLKQEYLLTSKSGLKEDQRKDIINRWITSSPLLQGVLHSINPDPIQAENEQVEKLRALERLCRDILKKLRAAATKRVKNNARLRASPSSITDDTQGLQPRRRSTRRARTRINSQTPSSASLHSYSAEDLSLLDDLNSLSPEDLTFFTPDGSTAFDSRHASPYSTTDLNLISTNDMLLGLSPAALEEDNIIDDEWYKSLQDQMNLGIQQSAAADELSLATQTQGQDADQIMDESCFDNLPDELNLDFVELVAPAFDAAVRTQEQDINLDMNETHHSSLPDDLDFLELVTPALDMPAETEEQDVNHNLNDAWYSNLQDQLHEDLKEVSGLGEILTDQQTQDGDDALVSEQTVDSAVPLTESNM